MSATAPSALLAVASDIARGAGAILRDASGRARTVAHKGPIDLVTDADHASEAYVLAEIARRFPDHAVLSEEAGRGGGDGPWRWVVDPLDGTTNFAHGVPHYAVLIAVQERVAPARFETRVAVTYDPPRDELFAAVRGAGATLDGVPVRVSATSRLVDSVLSTGFAYDRLWSADDNHAEFCRLNLVSQGVRRLGSAGLDLAWVAAGRLDAFWEYKLSPWDFAGGLLLVTEATGKVSTTDGGPMALDSRSVAASNGALHDDLLAAIASARAEPTGSRAGLDRLLPPEVRELVASKRRG